MKSKLLLLLLFICAALRVGAAVKVTARVTPSTVAAGETFKLEYTVNAANVGDITPPVFTGFEVLNGPAVSTFSSYQMVNSQVTGGSTTTFTYILSAGKAGSYTIPGAVVVVDGRKVKSNAVKIKVVKGQGGAAGSASGQGGVSSGEAMSTYRSQGKVGKKDLFITVTANKTKVYEQEPIVLTYKVFTQVNLTQLSGKMPDLKGFLSQEVPLPQQKSFTLERVNGALYRTTMWSQYVMFPQQTGKLTIPSIRFEGAVTMEDPNIDPIDAFFNGADYQVKVVRETPSVSVEVSPLPAPRPANFSGAVGRLAIASEVVTKTPRTNEALVVRVTVSGVGNMKLIKTPAVKFPTSFDVYDPKMTDRTRLTDQGMAGDMVYEYTVIPREKGKYTIPPLQFTYFDVGTNEYRTVETKAMDVDVAQGTKSVSDSEREMALRNSDIRPLHEGAYLSEAGRLWGSMRYVLLYVAFLFAAGVVAFLLRRQIRRNADTVGRKERMAGKAARMRMKQAQAMWEAGKADRFYEETLKALHGYVSDKFAIPTAQLNMASIKSAMASAGISETTIAQFASVAEACEYARFAPSGEPSQMKETYEQALQAIQQVAAELKRKKVKK